MLIMKRVCLIAGLSLVLAAGCSNGAGMGGLAVKDAGAVRACTALRDIVRARQTGALAPGELLSRAGELFNAAQSSSNTILRARAVAVYTDATNLVSSGESGSLDDDLRAMTQTCEGGGP
jgi:hypothetical protein